MTQENQVVEQSQEEVAYPGLGIIFTNETGVEFEEVEYYAVNNGFLVVQPKGDNLIAYNVDQIQYFVQITEKE